MMMPPDDYRKLIGILGRLGSDADGERAAAGLLATQLLQRHNITWSDLLPPPAVVTPFGDPKAERRARYPDRAPPPEPAHLLREHQREAFFLLRVSLYPWDNWKRKFLADMLSRRSPISERQREKLHECRRLAEAWAERDAA